MRNIQQKEVNLYAYKSVPGRCVDLLVHFNAFFCSDHNLSIKKKGNGQEVLMDFIGHA